MSTTKTQAEMVEEFITEKKDHETKLTLDFAKAILDCEIQKKDIADTVKDIKAEAKAEGILVKQVMKAVTSIKNAKKLTDLEKAEHDDMVELLSSDSDIMFKMETLSIKS
jgi:uncharacterized protein (UPF0335 family)